MGTYDFVILWMQVQWLGKNEMVGTHQTGTLWKIILFEPYCTHRQCERKNFGLPNVTAYKSKL